MKKQKKHGPTKPQGLNLAQTMRLEKQVKQETIHAEAWALFRRWSNNLQQEVIDAAFMAANDMFGMGPGRCEEFGKLIISYRDEITELINTDYEDDTELVYAKAKIDQRLKQICGGKFDPWEVRYKT